MDATQVASGPPGDRLCQLSEISVPGDCILHAHFTWPDGDPPTLGPGASATTDLFAQPGFDDLTLVGFDSSMDVSEIHTYMQDPRNPQRGFDECFGFQHPLFSFGGGCVPPLPVTKELVPPGGKPFMPAFKSDDGTCDESSLTSTQDQALTIYIVKDEKGSGVELAHLSDGRFKVIDSTDRADGIDLSFGLPGVKGSAVKADLELSAMWTYASDYTMVFDTLQQANQVVGLLNGSTLGVDQQDAAQLAQQQLEKSEWSTGVDLSGQLQLSVDEHDVGGLGLELIDSAGASEDREGNFATNSLVELSGTVSSTLGPLGLDKSGDLQNTVEYTVDDQDQPRELTLTTAVSIAGDAKFTNDIGLDQLVSAIKKSEITDSVTASDVLTISTSLALTDPTSHKTDPAKLKMAEDFMAALNGQGDPQARATAIRGFMDAATIDLTDEAHIKHAETTGLTVTDGEGVSYGLEFGQAQDSATLVGTYERSPGQTFKPKDCKK